MWGPSEDDRAPIGTTRKQTRARVFSLGHRAGDPFPALLVDLALGGAFDLHPHRADRRLGRMADPRSLGRARGNEVLGSAPDEIGAAPRLERLADGGMLLPFPPEQHR